MVRRRTVDSSSAGAARILELEVAASDRGDEMRMITMPSFFTAEEAVYTSVQIAMPRMET